MASFNPDHFLTGPVCKYSHVPRYQELGFNMNLGKGGRHSPLHLIFFKSKCSRHCSPPPPPPPCCRRPKGVLRRPRPWGQDLGCCWWLPIERPCLPATFSWGKPEPHARLLQAVVPRRPSSALLCFPQPLASDSSTFFGNRKKKNL